MTKHEMQVFQELCDSLTQDHKHLESKLKDNATPIVLGQLFFNRMQGVAYGVLKQADLLQLVNREFRGALQAAHEQNIMKNQSFFRVIDSLNELLAKQNIRYAMLKGAVLCKLYPPGYRTSNDIDLLICPEDVTAIEKVLAENGFVQGKAQGDTIVLASRKEIIESKMMRGETVPFIKRVDLPCMKYVEIDLNFSLDYKNSKEDTVSVLLDAAADRTIDGLTVRTLSEEDFFLHLCAHLYKEATTFPWVEMKRDMTLYKYSDLYLLLSRMTKEQVDRVFRRAKELRMTNICCFAITQTAELFANTPRRVARKAKMRLNLRPNLLHTVYDPKEKMEYRYTETNLVSRFFAENRAQLLQEVGRRK